MRNTREEQEDSSYDNIVAGKYALQKRIGIGGHGEVFQAYALETGVLVAVKLFYCHLHNEIVRYIHKEFKVLEKLSHPHILKIFSCGRWKRGDSFFFYLVTPLMDGGNLAEYMQKNSLDVNQSLEIILKIASALAYMHKNHFVHRDVKPQNILLDKEGNVFLSDFGIASQIDNTHTIAAGTMEYCSPEQMETLLYSVPDVRLDVYSLGITLYEMLCGVNPYRQIAKTRGEAAAIQFKYTQEYPLVDTYNSKIPHDLALVVAKMIMKNPEMRYNNMQNVIDELQPFYENTCLDDYSKEEISIISVKCTKMLAQVDECIHHKQLLKAETICNVLVKENPLSSRCWKKLGKICLQLKNFQKAVESFSKVLFLRADSYSSLCYRGYAYIMLNNFDAAKKDLEKAEKLYPNRGESLFYHAMLHRTKADLLEKNTKKYNKEVEKFNLYWKRYKSIQKW